MAQYTRGPHKRHVLGSFPARVWLSLCWLCGRVFSRSLQHRWLPADKRSSIIWVTTTNGGCEFNYTRKQRYRAAAVTGLNSIRMYTETEKNLGFYIVVLQNKMLKWEQNNRNKWLNGTRKWAGEVSKASPVQILQLEMTAAARMTKCNPAVR